MLRSAKRLMALVLSVLLVTAMLPAPALAADFDKENFKGLVLTTSVGSDQVSVKLYSGYAQTASKLMTPVYTEETENGSIWEMDTENGELFGGVLVFTDDILISRLPRLMDGYIDTLIHTDEV